MRVAIYARYSSDQQSDTSIDDQLRECERYAEREGWTVVARYSDRALSGASLFRPDLQRLLKDIDAFDIVLTEGLDRLSRSQADVAGLFEKLSFRNVKIVTLQEREIGQLHIGMKGTMNALALKDLADKTRRGLRGRVEAGKSGGGLCFGYRVASNARGEFEIVPEEAAVVSRIFREFVAGTSPKAIAKGLNAERVPGPRGQAWGPSTIHGNPKRGTGILNNELYVGRRIWSRLTYRKNPDTGRRVSRLNPSSSWTERSVPELRIIDDALWDAAKARQRATRHQLRATGALAGTRRAKYLFSGLLKCGLCGSNFTMCSKDRLACAGAVNRGTCSNTKTIRRDEVERRVLQAMEDRLWNQELFDEFRAEFTRELNRLRGEQGGAIAAARKELAAVEGKIAKCVNWITESWDGQKGAVADRMNAEIETFEQRRRELVSLIEAGERSRASRPLLHPNMHELYRDWVIQARDALQDVDKRTEAMEALRSMVQEITITPTSGGLEILLKGDLAEMLVAAGRKADSDDLRQQVMLVAGARFRHGQHV